MHAVGTLFQNFHYPTPCKVLFARGQFHPAAFPGKAAPHKTHATVVQAGKSLAPLHQFFYEKFTNHGENIASLRPALPSAKK
jgi:hypothetical protein